MPADVTVLRAARNAFLFVLLALVVVSTYQFATTGGIEPGIAVIWIVGAGGFYASKWYYGRSSDGADGAAETVSEDGSESVAEDGSEGEAEDGSESAAEDGSENASDQRPEIDERAETDESTGEGN